MLKYEIKMNPGISAKFTYDNSTCIYGRLDEMLSELWFIEALKVPPPL